LIKENYLHYLNIHSHRKPQSAEEIVLRNAFHLLSPEALNALPYKVSIGIHPWQVKTDYRKHLGNLYRLAAEDKVMAIGETGIDLLRDDNIKLQWQSFEQHLLLAEQVRKPVILHVVRAYEEILPLLRKFPLHYLFHDFRADINYVDKLRGQKCWFSFGKSLWNPHHAAIFKAMPDELIFLETDSKAISIEEVYTKAALIKGIPIEMLKRQMVGNMYQLFGNSL